MFFNLYDCLHFYQLDMCSVCQCNFLSTVFIFQMSDFFFFFVQTPLNRMKWCFDSATADEVDREDDEKRFHQRSTGILIQPTAATTAEVERSKYNNGLLLLVFVDHSKQSIIMLWKTVQKTWIFQIGDHNRQKDRITGCQTDRRVVNNKQKSHHHTVLRRQWQRHKWRTKTFWAIDDGEQKLRKKNKSKSQKSI